MVGATGFEPATYCSQSSRATSLRYAPKVSLTTCHSCDCFDRRLLLSSPTALKATQPSRFSARRSAKLLCPLDKAPASPQSSRATSLRYAPKVSLTTCHSCDCFDRRLLLSSPTALKATQPSRFSARRSAKNTAGPPFSGPALSVWDCLRSNHGPPRPQLQASTSATER